MQLKTNFHLHTGDDPLDRIPYTAYEALNRAAELGFEVISFTCHREVVHKKEYEEYAKRYHRHYARCRHLRIEVVKKTQKQNHFNRRRNG